jgi:sugar (pentulose or hexulose) kinase
MEGIAFGTRHILEILAGAGHDATEITACGGATRSPVFMQIYADVCGVPMSVAEVADAPLLGDAILAATGLGIYRSLQEAAQAMVRVAGTYIPQAGNHEAYQAYFEQYKATYGQLRGLMHEMRRVEGGQRPAQGR